MIDPNKQNCWILLFTFCHWFRKMACFRAKCSNRLLLMESIKKLDPLCSPHCACLQPRDQRCDDRKEVIFSSPRKWRYKGGCVASVPADWRFAACLSNLGDMFPPRQMAWNIKLELQFLPTLQSSGAVWKSWWPSWAFRPNEPCGFYGRKATLYHASALVTVCP